MRRCWIALALTMGLVAAGVDAGALDQAPTKLAKQAKSVGITKPGKKYRYEEATASSVEGTLTVAVDLPTAWSDRADSHFVRPDTEEPYGAGVRATTDADKFHNSFDVPGLKVNVTGEVADPFDAEELVRANAFEGCRPGAIKAYDNGTFAGSYQLFRKCDGKKAGAVVVVARSRRVMILVAGQVLTKADLAAFDRALRTITAEFTSV